MNEQRDDAGGASGSGFDLRIRRWRAVLAREAAGGLSDDVLDELEDHLRALLEDETAIGSDAEAVWRRAVARLGSTPEVAAAFGEFARRPAQRSAAVRRRSLRAWLDEPAQDVRFALRQMMRSKASSAVAVLTLAVGIGSVTWVFSLARATLFDPPRGVPEPHRVVLMFDDFRGNPMLTSFPRYEEYRDRNRAFAGLAAYAHMPVHVRARGMTQRHQGALATGTYFSTLGLLPWRGRFIRQDDDLRPGAHPVAVIGYELWRGRFAGEEGAVGESIALNGEPYTIIGVAPPAFRGVGVAAGIDVWVPTMMQAGAMPGPFDQLSNGQSGWLQVVGRLADGVDLATAQEHMSEIVRTSEIEKFGSDGALLFDRFWVSPFVRDRLRDFNALLAAVVGAVLLLAWANVAGLMLARGTSRAREMTTRAALGAGRGRLVRQLVTEGLLLAVVGGVVGLAVAAAGNRLLTTTSLMSDLAFADLDLRVDGSALGVALAVAGASSLVFTLWPALRISRGGSVLPPRVAGATAGRGATRARDLLVVAQIGAACTLLIGAGLLVRSLLALASIDPGFEPERSFSFTIDLELEGRDPSEGAALIAALLTELRRLPGVESASAGDSIPFGMASLMRQSGVGWLYMDGVPAPPELLGRGVEEGASGPMLAPVTHVEADYFSTLGIPFVAGRDFGPQEMDAGRPSIIVSRATASHLWPGSPAVGQTVRLGHGDDAGRLEVIGVVGDVRSGDLTRDQPLWIYRPLAHVYRPVTTVLATMPGVLVEAELGEPQVSQPAVTFLVRAAPETSNILPSILDAARATAPGITFFSSELLSDRVRRSLRQELLMARLVGLFACASLLLAATGIYAMVVHAVGNARREIGVRVALGARACNVVASVARIGALPALGGLAVGLGGGWLIGGALAGSIHGVTPHDPTTLAVVVVLMLATVAIASFGPARQALRVDPVRTLREE